MKHPLTSNDADKHTFTLEWFRELAEQGDYENLVKANLPYKLTASLAKLISNDSRIQEIKQQLSFIALTIPEDSLNCLITGETGTGKELVAQALGSVSSGSFVAINCAALPGELIESELFGHRKGAFTGADQDKVGLIQTAGGGTVFLDEIGDLSLSAQAKLLRVLSTRKIRRVGSTQDEPCRIQCRFIGATHKDLLKLIEQKLFREDLYWRLAQWTFYIPPLRERLYDIEDIISNLEGSNELTQEEVLALCSPEERWLGNVRELQARVTRIVISKRIEKYNLLRATWLQQHKRKELV